MTSKKMSKKLMKAKLHRINERVAENIKKAWYENGILLLEVYDKELWRGDDFTSFENYLEEQWGYKKTYGYDLIKSASFMNKLLQYSAKTKENFSAKTGKIAEILLPKSESQIRPLMQLKTDSEKIKVWCDVSLEGQSGKKITAELVQSKVNEFLESEIIVEDLEIEIKPFSTSTGNYHSSTGENDWYTPLEHIQAVIEVLGCIHVDPASSHKAQESIQANNYYTKDNCGLIQEWHGKVFMNPPYSMPEIKLFTDKLLAEIEEQRTHEAIVLTNNSSDTLWFHNLLLSSQAVCLTRGRVPFYNLENKTMATRQGQAFFYFGLNPEKFSSVFSRYGAIVKLYDCQ